MASQELRPYQEKMLDSIVAARLAGQNRVLVQAATGVGKTTVFSSLPTRLGPWLDSLPAKHRKMLVIAHREELIAQAVTRIRQNNPGLIVTKEKGNECANVYSDVIVASIQTLDARDQRRLHRLLGYMQFGLVIIDECHHASADSYRRVLAVLGFLPDHGGVAPLDSLLSSTKRTEAIAARMNAWDAVAPQDRLLVGFTATPNRTDAVGLSVVFQTIAFSYPMKAAIKDAWLAPPRALAVATDASLEGVRTTAGEFNQKDLATAVNTPQRNAQALLAWQQHALGRPTLGFTVDVAHAHAAADLWQKAGHRFMPISGQTPDDDRRMLLRQYTEGQIDGLFNAMLLTEGTDLPRTSCILHLKPTKSATLYEQMTGRGLRLFPGKDDCLILDMVDISRKHSLMAAPVLYGLPPLINAKGQRLDVLEADIAALRDEHAGVDLDAILSSLTDLDQLRSRLVEVNVFDVQPLDPSVLQATHLDWMRAGEVYRLNYPWSDGHETVRVSQDMLGHWDVAVEFHPRGSDATALRQRTIASQIANLATAVMLGESYVTEQRGSVAKMKSRTAHWKGNPASTKQMEFLKRLRVPFNAATLTSGAAGSLIDSALHHRRGRR